MEKIYLGTLFFGLLATFAMGVDHDVMQVQSPYVVKHPLGPSMEVHRRQPSGSSVSFRESRNANFPAYGRECYSCSTGTYGSSDWSTTGGSHSSGSHSTGSSYVSGGVSGYPTYGTPHSSSSRKEFRSEQKFINGQPVYELHHERKFQDGQLVHEERKEKDEDDFGVVRTPVMVPGRQVSGDAFDWGVQPSISRRTEEVRHVNRTYGSHGYEGGYSKGSHGSDGFSSSFDAEVARLREDLHRQVGTYKPQPILPTSGSSHRTEYHTQTRYVNGKPIYVKKEERKYEDGRLIHNSTEEKDADDLGTSDLQQPYETSGALSGQGLGGYYERRHQYQESFSGSNPRYPASSSYYGSDQRSDWDSSEAQYGSGSPSSSSSSSLGQSHYSSYTPTYESSIQTTHDTHSTGSHLSSESGGSSHGIPSAPESPHHSPAHPSYRPYSRVYSTYSRDQTHDSRGASSSYQPSHETSVHYRQESDDTTSSTTSGSSLGRIPTHYPQPSSSHTPGHRTPYSTYSAETRDSTSSSYKPESGSSPQISEESYWASSSYPVYRPYAGTSVSQTSESSYRPSSGRQAESESSRRTSEESYRTSSSYPGYRPYSSTSVSQSSESSYKPSSGGHPSSYPTYTSYEDGSSASRSYSEERDSSTSHSSDVSYTRDQSKSSTDGLEERHLLQSTFDSSMNTINPEYTHTYDQPYRPGASGSTYSHSRSHSASSDTHYTSPSDISPSTSITDGQARTFAIDLSSSSQSGFTSDDQDSRVDSTGRVYSSTYGRGESPSRREEHGSSYSAETHSSRETSSSTIDTEVGIPGVIRGPYTSHGEGDHYDKERYDISPLDDELPHVPHVENEIDSSSFPAPLPIDDRSEGHDTYFDHSSKSVTPDRDEPEVPGAGSEDSTSRTSDVASEYSHSSYLYNRTHTIYGTPVSQPSSAIDHSRRDYSRTSTVDESKRIYPASSGSRHYTYNETRRHSTLVGGQKPAYVSGSSLTSECTQVSGCAAGSSQTSSRRSEIRTSKRYVNGQLVGITHYERIYENGNLVHENVTEQGVDELTPAELQKYGIDQLNLVQGSYEPGSYSQRHEVKQEKKFVNGQQIYDLHHERQFEDGRLVHENRTEKDEDDFGLSSDDIIHQGIGHVGGYSDAADRHEVRQSQHMQQHVTSDIRPGTVGQSSETRHVADTSRVITNPVYTTRRHETRRQQEYINGQPIYDLHHERRYQDGSLVYENRTELDEKESSGSTGYRDALHDMMSGESLRTASESSYHTSSGTPTSGSYGSYYSGSHGGSSSSSSASSHIDGSYESSSSSVDQESSRISDSSSLGSSLLTEGSSLSHSGGATTTIFGTSSHGSSLGASLLTGGSSLDHSGTSSHESSGSSLTEGSMSSHSDIATTRVIGTSTHESTGTSLGSSLLTGDSSLGHSSGAATTTIIGASSHESSGSSVGSSFLTGGSSLGHSGGATTTVLGVSPGLESSSSESSRHYESSYEASQRSPTGSSGCLTCVLMSGGSGYSSHGSSSSHSASHGYSSGYSSSLGGTGSSDGYSQRREMSREEYYEDGQLVHGREEDRSFRDGQLLQQNRRVYSGTPGQIAGAEALQSAHTSYVGSSSASTSSSGSTSSSSHGSGARYGARVTVKGDTTGVCDPNPCMNGSTCIAGLRGPLCVCPFGFKGTRCEEAYCPRRFCRYGGTCNIVDGNHECTCKSGYSGARCLQRRSRGE